MMLSYNGYQECAAHAKKNGIRDGSQLVQSCILFLESLLETSTFCYNRGTEEE